MKEDCERKVEAQGSECDCVSKSTVTRASEEQVHGEANFASKAPFTRCIQFRETKAGVSSGLHWKLLSHLTQYTGLSVNSH
jgi:hypothetical protein